MNIKEEYKKFKDSPSDYIDKLDESGQPYTAQISTVCALMDAYPDDIELYEHIRQECILPIDAIVNNKQASTETRLKLIKWSYLSDPELPLISARASFLSEYYNDRYREPTTNFPITSHLELVLDASKRYKQATPEEKNTFWYCTEVLNFEPVLKDIAIAAPLVKNDYDLMPLLLFYAYADHIYTSRSIVMPTGSTLANMYDSLNNIAENIYGPGYTTIIETGRLLGVLDSQDYWLSNLKAEPKLQQEYEPVTFSENI